MTTSNLLSNEEISALLSSKSSTSFGAYGSGDHKVVEPLNFMNATRKEGAPSANFTANNERFVLSVSNALSRFLQQKVRIEMMEPRIMMFSDYLNTLEQPSLLGLVTFKSYSHKLLINVKQQLLYQVINILFGGNPARDKGTYQEFGKIDLKISQRLVELVLENLMSNWQEMGQLGVRQVDMILKPNTITTITPQHSMLVNNYILSINDVKTELQIVFDLDMLDDSRLGVNALGQTTATEEDRRWKEKMYESVLDIAAPAIAALPPIELKLVELSRLKEGDVIFLENHQLVDVHVAGLKLFCAQCGTANGSRVIHITECLR